MWRRMDNQIVCRLVDDKQDNDVNDKNIDIINGYCFEWLETVEENNAQKFVLPRI